MEKRSVFGNKSGVNLKQIFRSLAREGKSETNCSLAGSRRGGTRMDADRHGCFCVEGGETPWESGESVVEV